MDDQFDFNIDVDELTENNIKADQPENINIILKDHQLTLLQRCIEYENRTFDVSEFPIVSRNTTQYINGRFRAKMAVIGDRVGSGKSYVILSLLKCNNITENDNTLINSCGLNNVTYYIPNTKVIVKTNLLVIPHNLCTQWDNYIKKFSSTLKYKIINRQKIVDTLNDEFDINSYDLLVVTGTFYNRVAKYIDEKNIKLQRVIVDEVDNISLPGCYTVDACFMWFITASFGNLLYPRGYSKYESNMHRHIWCATGLKNGGFIKNIFMDLFANLPRELIKVLIVKNSEAYVEKSISLPPIFRFIIKCKTPNTIRLLTGIVDKSIIECLNANDVNGALSFISPSHKGNEDNIITLIIDKYNKQLTNIKLNLNMINQMIFENEQERQQEVDRINTRINDLNNKINALTDRVKNNSVCTICFDEIDDNKTVTQCCQNSFCFQCINTWLTKKASCPLCKSILTSNDYLVIKKDYTNDIIMTEPEEINPDKINDKFDKYKNLEIILKNRKPGSKLLIFSAHDGSFYDVLPILIKLNIKYDFLKGSGYQINSIINKYNGTDLDVLLVNMRHYGCGLNIDKTTDIIMFHRFDNQAEQQLIGRAHRMGRVASLNVHYLLYENEIMR
jgi:SNF2 family DNA or RNA helicase